MLNEFTYEIIDFLLKDLNYKNTYKIRYNNLIINIDIIINVKQYHLQ